MKASMKVAGHIDKEDFLKQLKSAWKSELKHKHINVDHEAKGAMTRINESDASKVFLKVGVTEDDVRRLLSEIKSEAPTPRR